MKEKLKQLFGENQSNKKKTENLFVFLIILIFTLIAINFIWKDDKKNEQKSFQNSRDVELAKSNDENNLETRLENILGEIDGVGKVSVLITYSESSAVSAMYNEKSTTTTTSENDSSGGTRVTESVDHSKEIVSDSNSEPITEKKIMPKIKGAIIAAEGAGNGIIKSSIISAVEAATGIATHKIQVFQMKT